MTSETKTAKYKFTDNIIKLSVSKQIQEAISEWDFRERQDRPEDALCLCQHKLEKEIYYYQNSKNGNVIGVGESCRKKFNFIQETKSTNSILQSIWVLTKGEYAKIDNLFMYCIKQKEKLAQHLNALLERITNQQELEEKKEEIQEIVKILRTNNIETSLFDALLLSCESKIQGYNDLQEKKLQEKLLQEKKQQEYCEKKQREKKTMEEEKQKKYEKEMESAAQKREKEEQQRIQEKKEKTVKAQLQFESDTLLENQYVKQLDERGKRLHELAIEQLESSYFVKQTHGFKAWLKKQPTHNTQSPATK